jgi:hypothetical protein
MKRTTFHTSGAPAPLTDPIDPPRVARDLNILPTPLIFAVSSEGITTVHIRIADRKRGRWVAA